MQEIFNLSKIKKRVDSKHPPAIIVVDTNIIMNTPDFRQWKTTVSEPIFILSDVVLIELEHIRNRRKKEVESVKSADEAINRVSWLFHQGDIIDGILITEVGWFISIPSPAEDAINEALRQLGSIVEGFGRGDSKFIILTRELSELMPDNTVVFYTGDINLYNVAQANGFPVSYTHLTLPTILLV